jgi:hypothetical protein
MELQHSGLQSLSLQITHGKGKTGKYEYIIDEWTFGHIRKGV